MGRQPIRDATRINSGESESDHTELAVFPAGGSTVVVVTTVTPAAKRRDRLRISAARRR